MQMQMIACCYCARPAHARHGPSAQSSPHRLPICNQSRTAGFLFGAIKDEAAIWKEAGEVAAVATSFHFDSLLSKSETCMCIDKKCTLSIQPRRSASASRGGGRVIPESSVKVVGTNCKVINSS
uniref:Uncharacterized protein n=1 Tax=Oryza glumipatula TaxID=40148 RepID=A0A0D9Z2H6_9ORYZ